MDCFYIPFPSFIIVHLSKHYLNLKKLAHLLFPGIQLTRGGKKVLFLGSVGRQRSHRQQQHQSGSLLGPEVDHPRCDRRQGQHQEVVQPHRHQCRVRTKPFFLLIYVTYECPNKQDCLSLVGLSSQI